MATRSVRRRLGLALSGGGFRASLFHLGVLRRLAELGILRHVAVISSVSGGSIVAAHYVLQLKRRILASPNALKTGDYVEVVRQVEQDFCEGLRGNLRSRLLLNPFHNLLNLVGATSLSQRMARLYTHYLYRRALADGVGGRGPHLRDLVVPLDKGTVGVPDLVLNASSLNSGGCFRLTAVEVGEPTLGYIRLDEQELVLWYKRAIHRASLGSASDADPPPSGLSKTDRARLDRRFPAHHAWWRFVSGSLSAAETSPENAYRNAVRDVPAEDRAASDFLVANPPLGGRLKRAGLGALRKAKVAAWYLRHPDVRERAKGPEEIPHEDLVEEFWNALEDLDGPLAQGLRDQVDVDSIADLVLDLYYLRSAHALAWSFGSALNRLTLADAVAMSANFPPVFGPFRVADLYNPHSVRVCALTDGGVHDNQGIDTLIQDGCTGIIASDASGTLSIVPDQSGIRSKLLGRIGGILGTRLRELQVAALRERRRVTAGVESLPDGPDAPAASTPLDEVRERYRLEHLAFFHLLTDPEDARPVGSDPPPPHPDRVAVAGLRTDLDVFGEVEMDALIHQGYQLADRFCRDRRYVPPDLLEPSPAPADSGIPLPAAGPDTERAHRILTAGAHRFGRLFILFPWLRQVSAAAVALVVIGWALKEQVSVLNLFDTAGTVLHGLAAGFPVSGTVLAVPGSGAGALIVAVIIAALWPSRPPRLTAAVSRRMSANAARQAHVERTARRINLWRRNLWWILALVFALLWGRLWWLVATAPLWGSVLASLFSVILLISGAITARSARRGRSTGTS